ncbi:hypothetical protein [Candidatus Nitrotoga sp. 1052]|uniref:hypothetical protein n=1 Tax=Candidatus Nitrotoga sp. 1052 TaxID=2886964 RepID=UPI001EF70A97|nr:hypothetical protein [Candidatus Nitrotoga sp. 1052]
MSWPKACSDEHQVEVLAHCLTINHIHLAVVLATQDGLRLDAETATQELCPAHHLGARLEKSPLARAGFLIPRMKTYLWAAVRYVELNAVSAGIERRAESYHWSSAAANCSSDRK